MSDPVVSYQPVVEFFVAGHPIPQGSKRAFKAPGGRIVLREDAGARHEQWRGHVADEARAAMRDAGIFGQKETGPLAVSLTFHMVRGVGMYGSGRNEQVVKASAPKFPVKPPDVDKLTRAVFDALTHIVWVDDAQVVVTTQRKVFCDRFTETPGVHVVVRRVV